MGGELAGAAGLTERQNTFARREAVMAWAAAHGQGAPAEAVERAAARFLTRRDVHRSPDPSDSRFTTSDLIAHEEAIVRGAQARQSEGSGRLDGALVDAVLDNVPFAPTAEQAAVIRGLTSSGHGVDSVEALAGTGKTFTAGLLARAYAAGGFRVTGTAPTARAVRELKEEAGIRQAWTLTRLALDLDAAPSGFGRGPAVLILDEAGMAGTRETARVFEHAGAGGVKVVAIGDSGQLSSVQAGGWLGSLTRRLGSYELREVTRQRDPRERALLAHVRRGDPNDYLTEKTARGQLHIFTGDHETALAAEHAAVAVWRDPEAASPSGQAVLIARDNARRARLNALARAELERQGRLGERLEAAMRRRDDEDLALDRIDSATNAAQADINLPPARGSADGNDPAPQSSTSCEPTSPSCTPSLTKSGPHAKRGSKHNASSTRQARESPNSSADLAAFFVAAQAIQRGSPSNASASRPPNTKSWRPRSANENLPAAFPPAGLRNSSTRPRESAPPQSRPSSRFSVSAAGTVPSNPPSSRT